MIINNRLDAWWSNGMGDSGIGGALILGTAKYFNDNHIIPKYNLTFLFTTGEEYNSRGNWYYLHSLSLTQQARVLGFFTIDQAGLAQKNTTTVLYSNRDSTNKALNAIADLMNYDDREKNLGYPTPIIQNNISAQGGSEADVWGEFNSEKFGKDVFVLGKDPDRKWIGYHRAGENYSLGDVLKITTDPQGNTYGINRSEVNLSLELFINITKYYCMNPNCFISSITYHPKDSTNDDNTINDSIQVNYTIHESLPQDQVMAKAVLYADANPSVYKYTQSKDYTLTSTGVSDSINISLPKNAPFGTYKLILYVYNSTGLINKMINGENHKKNQNVYLDEYADDYYVIPGLRMGPPNDLPNTPNITAGPTHVQAGHSASFNTSTTDLNFDNIIYQFDWKANKLNHDFSDWSIPIYSGQQCTMNHTWYVPGKYQVSVHANDIWNSPTTTDWSKPWKVNVTVFPGCVISAQKSALVNEQVVFTALNYGAAEPLQNYTWTFTAGAGLEIIPPQYTQIASVSFSSNGQKKANLTVVDALGNTYYFDHHIQVKYVISDFTENRSSTKPNVPIQFTNISRVYSGAHITSITWDFGDQTTSHESNPVHTFVNTGDYNVTLTVQDNKSHNDVSWNIIHIETTKPAILYSTYAPDYLPLGSNVTLSANFYDNISGIDHVTINITDPDSTACGNFTMYTDNGSVYEYNYCFNDTMLAGQYNYTLWVTDQAGNMNRSQNYSFFVSQASPEDGSINVSTKPYLTVHLDDPNNENANVSFYQYNQNAFTIDSENNWTSNAVFHNVTTDGNGNLQLNDTFIFGNGSDGDFFCPPGTYTLPTNMNYHNLTINASRTLDTAGFIIRVSGTLLNKGTIKDTISGGDGGEGGEGGLKGYDMGSQHIPPGEGDPGTDGDTSSGAGKGGHGGGGGGGGGAAWSSDGHNADGGNGGDGGDGGKGGGSVKIFACKLNNSGVIQVNGSNGYNNAQSGEPGEYVPWGNGLPWNPYRDISGGGGGGGGGGNGSDGGKINFTYIYLLKQGKMYGVGGHGGNKGNNGTGHDNEYGAIIGDNQSGASGDTSGGGHGGHGGYGEWQEGASTPGYDNTDGQDGAAGQINPFIKNKYKLKGNYTKVLDAGSTVEWAKATITQTIPSGTDIHITYANNSQGNIYYENISQVPACRYLKFRINFTTNNFTATPSIDKMQFDTRTLLSTDTNVPDDTNVTYRWTGRQLNTQYLWQVRLFKNTSSAYGPVWNFKTIPQRIFQINDVTETPYTIGLGYSVIIDANITENDGGLTSVTVNITNPDNIHGNYTMDHTTGNIYEYNFSSAWQTGQYDYTVWAQNDTGSKKSSNGHHFNVTANATIDVCTIKNNYGENDYVNLTDPPEGGEPELPTSDGGAGVIARGLTWNLMQSQEGRYRYEGSMEPMNYLENQVWKPINTTIVRSEKPGYDYQVTTGLYQAYFKENPTEDDMVHAAYTQPDNLDLTASLDLQPYELLWRNQNNQVQRINMVQNVSGYPVAHIWPSEHEWHHNLDTMLYPNIFGYGTNLTLEYSNSRLSKKLWVNPGDLPAPVISDEGLTLDLVFKLAVPDSLSLWINDERWNPSIVTTSNDTVVLRNNGVAMFSFVRPFAFEKFHWTNDLPTQAMGHLTYEFRRMNGECFVVVRTPASFVFNESLRGPIEIDPTIEISIGQSSDDAADKPLLQSKWSFDTDDWWYWLGNADNFKKYVSGWRFQQVFLDDSCTIVSGSFTLSTWAVYGGGIGAKSKCYGFNTSNPGTWVVTTNEPRNASKTHKFSDMIVKSSDVPNGIYVPRSFNVTDIVKELLMNDSWVSGNNMSFICMNNVTSIGSTLSASTFDASESYPAPKLTIEFVNHPPEISSPYPANGTMNVSLTPEVHVSVNDSDRDNMTVSWYWGNSTGNCTHLFGINCSVGNGTYYQNFSNATVNGQWWYWKVVVDDGYGSNMSDIYRFFTGVQSKIVNSGMYPLQGCLLVQVQFFNTTTQQWVKSCDVYNWTDPDVFKAGQQVALDTIFNGYADTTSLIALYGYGMYRVYAALRDQNGHVYVLDDETKLEATWNFTITSS
jgi:hypothetical protein